MAATGGRPRSADAARLSDRIVAEAARLFLLHGYAATSIEAIAGAASVSKRTFYARFNDKSAVFLAVVRHLVGEWLVGLDEAYETTASLEEALLIVARRMLQVALTPTALALYSLVTAEAMRFPDLATAIGRSGADAGVTRVTALLRARYPGLTDAAATFAAEQFQSMVVVGPRRRAMGLGAPLDPAGQERWCKASVALLLRGVVAEAPQHGNDEPVGEGLQRVSPTPPPPRA